MTQDKQSERSIIRASEQNDCTVRALMHAYDISYQDAHGICKRFGREDRQGFHIQAELIGKLGLKIEMSAINKRVSQVLRSIDKNKVYICLVLGHIFTIRHNVPCEAIEYDAEKGFARWLTICGVKKVIRLFEVPPLKENL